MKKTQNTQTKKQQNIQQFLGLNSFDTNAEGVKMSHNEKYEAIVNAIGLERCISYLPASKEKIIKSLKTDEHLNNINIKLWDEQHDSFKREFLRIGINLLSISGTVCTLKCAARMYAAQE